MLISWADSYDNDTGDSVSGANGIVIKDGSMTTIEDYAEEVGTDYCILSFDKAGTYEIRMRVSDSHGAWSNWVVFNAVVGDSSYIRYSPSTGTNFVNSTTVKVSSGGDSYSEKVICEIGYSKNPIIGNFVYYKGEWYYI